MPDLRAVRLLLDHEGTLRRICKITFTRNDASMYLIPYSANRRFYYGSRALGESELEDTFDYAADGIEVPHEPHLSIHESGQVRVYASGSPIAGPMQIPALTQLRGEHVATVTVDTFDALALHDEPLSTRASELDHVIPVDDGVESGRLAIYVNGHEESFAGGNCRLTFTLCRPSLEGPLFVGIKTVSQFALTAGAGHGSSVIAGWDPTQSPDAAMDYLYIRGD